MHNSRIGAVQHVITCGRDGTLKYDQPVLANHAGVVCVPIDFQKNLVLIKRYREVVMPVGHSRTVPIKDGKPCGLDSLELPRGGCEPGETGREAAIRETEEETRFLAKSAQRISLTNADTAFFPYSNEAYLLWVDTEKSTSRPVDPNEEIEIVTLGLSNVLQAIRLGEIICGHTQAAVAAYMALLAKEGSLAESLES